MTINNQTADIDAQMQALEDGVDTSANEEGMSIWEHLKELRTRLLHSILVLFVIFLICFFWLAEPLYEFLAKPMRDSLSAKGIDPSFYFSAAFSPIITQLRLSFLAAIFFGFPFLSYQIWRFIAPGLYKKEQQLTIPILFGMPILFFCGAAFARYLMFPIIYKFAISFADTNLSPLIEMSKYLTDSVRLILAFGVCFELPLVISVLNIFGIVDVAQLKSWRRYFILVAAIIGAILTPADLLSMFLLAIPMLALYELSILLVSVLEKRR